MVPFSPVRSSGLAPDLSAGAVCTTTDAISAGISALVRNRDWSNTALHGPAPGTDKRPSICSDSSCRRKDQRSACKSGNSGRKSEPVPAQPSRSLHSLQRRKSSRACRHRAFAFDGSMHRPSEARHGILRQANITLRQQTSRRASWISLCGVQAWGFDEEHDVPFRSPDCSLSGT